MFIKQNISRRRVLRNLSILGMASLVKVGEVGYSNPLALDTKSELADFEEANELAPGVFFIKGKLKFFQNGDYQEVECNNGWIVFEDFVVLIDSNFPAKAKVLLDEIRKTTSKPVRYVFNTHHHGDHLYGNKFWFDQGAAIISHTGVVQELRKYETGYYSNVPGSWENTAAKRADLKGYSLLPPSTTFSEKLVIEDKSRRLELLHLGAGHTKGDAVAWLPEQKILFAGDSCLNGPYNLFMDAEVSPWIKTLEKMHGLQPDILVPGHGDLGNRETVINQQQYFKVLYHWIDNQKRSGFSFDAIKGKLPELRSLIEKDEKIRKYLIPEPAVMPAFSLEAQAKKIFEQII